MTYYPEVVTKIFRRCYENITPRVLQEPTTETYHRNPPPGPSRPAGGEGNCRCLVWQTQQLLRQNWGPWQTSPPLLPLISGFRTLLSPPYAPWLGPYHGMLNAMSTNVDCLLELPTQPGFSYWLLTNFVGNVSKPGGPGFGCLATRRWSLSGGLSKGSGLLTNRQIPTIYGTCNLQFARNTDIMSEF